jgi:hypothetical protein
MFASGIGRFFSDNRNGASGLRWDYRQACYSPQAGFFQQFNAIQSVLYGRYKKEENRSKGKVRRCKMYIYRGGQIVEEGIYLESDKHGKVVLKASGFLPGTDKEVYFKLPESYLLVPVLLLGLALSMAIPYGVGVVIFAVMFILHNILFSFVSTCEELLRGSLAHITMGYKPNMSFFSGNSKKLKKRKGRDTKKEG